MFLKVFLERSNASFHGQRQTPDSVSPNSRKVVYTSSSYRFQNLRNDIRAKFSELRAQVRHLFSRGEEGAAVTHIYTPLGSPQQKPSVSQEEIVNFSESLATKPVIEPGRQKIKRLFEDGLNQVEVDLREATSFWDPIVFKKNETLNQPKEGSSSDLQKEGLGTHALEEKPFWEEIYHRVEESGTDILEAVQNAATGVQKNIEDCVSTAKAEVFTLWTSFFPEDPSSPKK